MSFLEIDHVSFTYPRHDKPVLTDVHLHFDQGVITALVGPNGSGKTTLTRLMMSCGFLREIRLEGRPLVEYSLKSDAAWAMFSKSGPATFLQQRG